MPSLFVQEQKQVAYEINSIKIILKSGSILDEIDVNAIVIPVPIRTETDNRTFTSFHQIFDSKDPSTENLWSNIKPCSAESISYKSRKLVLVVPPKLGQPGKAESSLEKAYLSCLIEAQKYQFSMLAFLPIGAVGSGFYLEDNLKCAFQAIRCFKQHKISRKLREIRIIIEQPSIYPIYLRLFTMLLTNDGSVFRGYVLVSVQKYHVFLFGYIYSRILFSNRISRCYQG